jgi:hypothetical protein
MLGAFAFSNPAGAGTTLKIKCTSLTGTIAGSSWSLSGCSGNTGGTGTFPPTNFNITITWANGKSTSFQYSAISGVDSDPDPHGTCPALRNEIEVKGTVTSDSTGSAPVGGLAYFELCEKMNPGTKVLFEPGSAAKFE